MGIAQLRSRCESQHTLRHANHWQAADTLVCIIRMMAGSAYAAIAARFERVPRPSLSAAKQQLPPRKLHLLLSSAWLAHRNAHHRTRPTLLHAQNGYWRPAAPKGPELLSLLSARFDSRFDSRALGFDRCLGLCKAPCGKPLASKAAASLSSVALLPLSQLTGCLVMQ